MRGFNERKAEMLRFIDRMGEATASEVARDVNINSINASRLLGHYFRQGLLSRHTINKFGTKSYQITEKGRERLNWISGGQ